MAFPSRSKFRNVVTIVDGIKFHSKREAKRWAELKLLERSGQIGELRRQVPFILEIKGIKIETYRADFVYNEGGREVVEDSKGMITKDFRRKFKWMKAVHGVEVRLT